MKLNMKHWFIVKVVFVVMLLLSILTTYLANQYEVSHEKVRARLNAEIYAERLKQDLNQGIFITDTLEQIILDNNGKVHNFESTARRLTKSYISSIQLAPAGQVTKIYPEAGNEEGKIDLLNDADRAPIALYTKQHNKVTMQGPFKLKQGGKGIAIRNPVYTTEDNGNKKFWGFTIVIVKTPDIYQKSLSDIVAFNLDYCLDITKSPLSEKSVRVASSVPADKKVQNPQKKTFVIGECTWSIAVGTKIPLLSSRAITALSGGLVVTALVTVMAYLILRQFEEKNILNSFAYKDELTGLYSRRGFMNELEKISKDSSTKNMRLVIIDLDDFKQINDVYGHVSGDDALIALTSELKKCFSKNCIIGRTGGDEFCVLIVNEEETTANTMIDKAVTSIHSFYAGDKKVYYTISAGYADYPVQAKDSKELLVLADEALYASKLDGKNNAKRYQEEMSDIKRTQLGFSAKSFAAGIPGALLVYRADEKETILFANDDMFDIVGCKDFGEFLDYTHSSFSGLVHPEDVKRVNKEIWDQVHDLQQPHIKKKNIDDVVHYRIITKTGAVKDVMDVGRLIHDDNYGDIFFVYIREKAEVIK